MGVAQADLKIWRESASLILTAKLKFSPSLNFNYRLLCLQRSSDSKVLANSYVFPGGNISKSDSSISWLKLFKKFGYNLESFKQLYPVENVPLIIENESTGRLPKYLSLRICAIRETFEESGILICKSGKIKNKQITDWGSYIGGAGIIKWQNKVYEDPYNFLNLCTQLDMYPDVWSLHNWSNWMTPRDVHARFNTMFFFTCLDQVPSVHREEREIQNIKWAVPDECIEENQSRKIMLPVPQFYETSRLRNFHDINLLCKYAKERSHYGCEKYFPYRIRTKEGMYYIFPGDELYSGYIDNINYVETIPECNVENRLLLKDYLMKLIVRNFASKDRHLPPKI